MNNVFILGGNTGAVRAAACFPSAVALGMSYQYTDKPGAAVSLLKKGVVGR